MSFEAWSARRVRTITAPELVDADQWPTLPDDVINRAQKYTRAFANVAAVGVQRHVDPLNVEHFSIWAFHVHAGQRIYTRIWESQ